MRIVIINTTEFYCAVPVINTVTGHKDSVNIMPNGGRGTIPVEWDTDESWMSANPGFLRREIGEPVIKGPDSIPTPVPESKASEQFAKNMNSPIQVNLRK